MRTNASIVALASILALRILPTCDHMEGWCCLIRAAILACPILVLASIPWERSLRAATWTSRFIFPSLLTGAPPASCSPTVPICIWDKRGGDPCRAESIRVRNDIGNPSPMFHLAAFPLWSFLLGRPFRVGGRGFDVRRRELTLGPCLLALPLPLHVVPRSPRNAMR